MLAIDLQEHDLNRFFLALIVPEQISDDKGDVTNSRNLTLKDLLTQLKHYNQNIRKGAFTGIVSFYIPSLLNASFQMLFMDCGISSNAILPLCSVI